MANGWAILVAAFRGENAEHDAGVVLSEVRLIGQLPYAYIQRRGEDVVIVSGSFADPTSPEAQSELKRIQDITVNGGKPYAASFLVPPLQGAVAGSSPEMDLLRAGAKYGADRYTLEVAIYGRSDRKPPANEAERTEFRKKAEEAAAVLRRDGELAFYYHGPTVSSVTVGVFSIPDDFDPQAPGFRSPNLAEARRRHPHHLFNGRPYRISGRGIEKAGLAEAQLRKIPAAKE